MQVKNVSFNPLIIKYNGLVISIGAQRIGEIPDDFLKSPLGKNYRKILIRTANPAKVEAAQENISKTMTNNPNPMGDPTKAANVAKVEPEGVQTDPTVPKTPKTPKVIEAN